MARPPRLTITEIEPVPLLRDFDTFINYIKENQISLTKVNSYISKADLFKLNMSMTNPETKPTKNSDLLAYPLLNFFYHLVLSGRLFIRITADQDGRKFLEPDNRLKLYEALTLTEKYFFLLETFWTDINWLTVGQFYFKNYTYIYEVPVLIAYLSSMKPGQRLDLIKTDRLSTEYLFLKSCNINLYLSYLGFIEVTPNEEMMSEINRRVFFPASIIPTAFGVLMADILTRYRHLPLWNLPYRRAEGEYKAVPGTPLPENSEYREMMLIIKDGVLHGDKTKLLVPNRPSKTDPFFKPFLSCFAKDELQKTLPRLENTFNDGTYVFKVYLNKKIWRRIETAARHTLEDLHWAIQDAFDFQDDHLYSFFMDGILWSEERFACPEEDEGPYSNEVRIGELSLYKGQRILYLFDYGDMWRFDVVLEGIYNDRALPFKPMVIEKHGQSYVQYYESDE